MLIRVQKIFTIVYFCKMKLYMLLLGCKPKGRFTEQHDTFFGIAESLQALVPQVKKFWPEAKDAMHIDTWREVTAVDGYRISVVPKSNGSLNGQQLFFLNLGGYKPDDFEEYHYKILTVANHLAEAVKKGKASSFYKHYGFSGAVSHIDNKYGIDVDDTYMVEDMLAEALKGQYQLEITKSETALEEDQFHIGYLTLNKLAQQ